MISIVSAALNSLSGSMNQRHEKLIMAKRGILSALSADNTKSEGQVLFADDESDIAVITAEGKDLNELLLSVGLAQYMEPDTASRWPRFARIPRASARARIGSKGCETRRLGQGEPVKYWEIIGDKLSAAGGAHHSFSKFTALSMSIMRESRRFGDGSAHGN